MRLSRAAFTELGSHRLNAVLRFLGIPILAGRQAPRMPDAELTVQVLQKALAAEHEHLWATFRDLDAAAGIAPPRRERSRRCSRAETALLTGHRPGEPGDLGD